VCLEVRPQPAGARRKELRHAAQVAVEGSDVEDESWRGYVADVVDHESVNR
jgi:hypothetical protein